MRVIRKGHFERKKVEFGQCGIKLSENVRENQTKLYRNVKEKKEVWKTGRDAHGKYSKRS